MELPLVEFEGWEGMGTDLLDMQGVDLGLLECLLHKRNDPPVDGTGQQVEPRPVDRSMEVHPFLQTLDRARRSRRCRETLLRHLDRQPELHKCAVVRRGEGDAGLLGELLGEPVHELGVEEVSSEVRVMRGREGSKESITDGDDGDGRRGSSDVDDEGVAVDTRRLLLLLSDERRVVGGERRGGLGDGLEDTDACLLGGSDGSLDLGGAEVGGDGEDGSGDLASDKVGSVGEEDGEVADGDLVCGQGRGGTVDGDGERRNSVRVDNGGRVVRLLHRLDLVVTISHTMSADCAHAYETLPDSRLAEEIPESKNRVLCVPHELDASRDTKVLQHNLSAPDPSWHSSTPELTSSVPLKETAVGICLSPSSLAMQSASPSCTPSMISSVLYRVPGARPTLLRREMLLKDPPKLSPRTVVMGTRGSRTTGVAVPDWTRLTALLLFLLLRDI